jgi:hypothetical protein
MVERVKSAAAAAQDVVMGLQVRMAPTPTQLAALLERSYRVRKHLTVIGEAFAAAENKTVDRVIITAPPQCGKSETAARWGPFWWLTKHPEHKVALVSYGDSLAVKHSRAIRRFVTTHGSRFGLELRTGSGSAHDWEMSSGGGMRAVGVESGLTGHPGDIVIIDDPLKDRQDAESMRMRDLVWDCYSGTIIPRLSPRAPIIIIATRWHPDDLIGRVLAAEGSTADGGRWHVVHLPAMATAPDDVLNRQLGDPLPHPKIRENDKIELLRHWQDKRKTVTPRDWAALYQGDPRPVEGALIDGAILQQRRHFDPQAKPVRVAVAVDPSGGGRDAAGIIAGWLGDDAKLYWSHDKTGRMPSDQWARAACQLAHDIGADVCICEQNYGGDMAKLVLRTAWQSLARENAGSGQDWGMPPMIKMVHSRRGKMLRAEPVAQQIMEDRVRFSAYLPELEHEWATWVVGGDSPGRIDASVHLAFALLPPPGATGTILNPNDYGPIAAGETPYTRLRIVR